jgi:hypothetical protein
VRDEYGDSKQYGKNVYRQNCAQEKLRRDESQHEKRNEAWQEAEHHLRQCNLAYVAARACEQAQRGARE